MLLIFGVCVAVITPLAPADDVIVTVPGVSPSSKNDSVSSIDVISPLPPTAVILPTVLPAIIITSFTAYPVPGVVIINESFV